MKGSSSRRGGARHGAGALLAGPFFGVFFFSGASVARSDASRALSSMSASAAATTTGSTAAGARGRAGGARNRRRALRALAEIILLVG